MKDYEELLLLSGDANHAREIAQMELDRVRSGYEEERNDVVDEKKNPVFTGEQLNNLIQKENMESPGTSLPGSSPSLSEIGFDQPFPTSATPIDPDQQEVIKDPADDNGVYFDFSKVGESRRLSV